MRKAKNAAIALGSAAAVISGVIIAGYAVSPVVGQADPKETIEVYDVKENVSEKIAALTSIRSTATRTGKAQNTTSQRKESTVTKAPIEFEYTIEDVTEGTTADGYYENIAAYSATAAEAQTAAPTEVQTEAYTEAATEAQTEAQTAATEAATEAYTYSASYEEPTYQQETTYEYTTEYYTEAYTEPSTAYYTEYYTEPSTEYYTEYYTEPSTAYYTEASTAAWTEPSTSTWTEAPTTTQGSTAAPTTQAAQPVQSVSTVSGVSDSDYIILCNAVAHEAGSNWISTYDKAKVVEVIMNRVNSSLYPNTVTGVLTQPYQFTGASSYVYLGAYSSEVSQDVKDAVTLYFSDPSSFSHGYYSFWGDGYQNHFS
ncbi:MAG: cell wall hydrolase [Ruminococcus sp.]|nr:cell wall hydrolase [Ruminococcus sp.]